MAKVSISKLRRTLLAERDTAKNESLMTAKMFQLEHKTGRAIQDLLAPDSRTGRQIAKRLGISDSVLCRCVRG